MLLFTMRFVRQARMFILSVAYSLAFGALFFKTWRVHLIMANKRLDKIVSGR